MSEPYLIAHLVRGEPAFDIAIPLQIGNEEGWIIPTSGHRAYPYAYFKLYAITEPLTEDLQTLMLDPPTDWPDHYTPTAAPRGQGLIRDLASILNLIPRPTIRRR